VSRQHSKKGFNIGKTSGPKTPHYKVLHIKGLMQRQGCSPIRGGSNGRRVALVQPWAKLAPSGVGTRSGG